MFDYTNLWIIRLKSYVCMIMYSVGVLLQGYPSVMIDVGLPLSCVVKSLDYQSLIIVSIIRAPS